MSVFGQRVRQTQHNLQCLYDLNRRVHCVKTYPVLSPQGANIVIYGHENGVTIVWRGGRRLKDTTKPSNPISKPASTSDSVMILDSDDDSNAASASASTTTTFSDKPVFEDFVADTNAGGFSDVVQTLDLALSQSVLSVAVLPIAPCAAKDAEPSFLQEHMVFAITCRATTDVYVATVPLTPPSHEAKSRPQLRTDLVAGNLGKGAFGDTLVALGGCNRRCEGVAIALAKQGTSSTTTGSRSSSPPTRLIVAAHSREASGTLRLWDVTVAAKRPSPDRAVDPFQTEYLPSPLTGLAFNPTHPTQLLAVDPQRAVRIYDYTIPAIPSEEANEGPHPPQGSWLLSLYPPFARGGPAVAARKPIVAAAWIARGHAILALMADGQWGIWDIDRSSTSGSTGNGRSGGLFGAASSTSGVRGAALTTFAISGQIEGTTPLRNPVAASRKSTDGDFVPMTPHTRRDALAVSFGTSGGAERLVATPGGVEVVQQRSLRGSTVGKETAVLWLGGADYIVGLIPDVDRFWDSQSRRASGGGGGGNLFSGTRPTRMIRLQDLNASLQGERCCGAAIVSWLPKQSKPFHQRRDDDGEEDEDEEKPSKDQLLEIIVQGESRLVAVHESNEDSAVGGLTTRLLAASAARKRTADSVTSAIVTEPRTRKPGTVKFDLDSLPPRSNTGLRKPLIPGGAGSTPRRPALTQSLFDAPGAGASSQSALTPQKPLSHRSLFDENEVTLTMSMMRPPAQKRAAIPDFAFAAELENAANATDDEEVVQERNIEEEMLDIMEIDRELEAMEGRRDGGGHNIFFESA
ncbi:hypothetical protein F503_03756 [Ophiostoma piceae UAMH 11346]|uniref:Nucleoporin NUP37 n=1 Tax=Ophiostoma piceae (strain UAMH 11346) TaxID=1262450 RepID=S3C0C8_OPHP1|nr:hypothetical protein F503_03756 [Ophiostoma piceae UAMH 11346]